MDVIHNVNVILEKHLTQFNIYDLERLEQCFMHEYRFHPENKDAIDDILMYIRAEMTNRKGA